jgi:hypothetical protein
MRGIGGGTRIGRTGLNKDNTRSTCTGVGGGPTQENAPHSAVWLEKVTSCPMPAAIGVCPRRAKNLLQEKIGGGDECE